MLWVPVSNSRRSTPWCQVSNSVFRTKVISRFSFVLVTIPKVWNWADSLGQGISHTILIKLVANGIYFGALGEDFFHCRWQRCLLRHRSKVLSDSGTRKVFVYFFLFIRGFYRIQRGCVFPQAKFRSKRANFIIMCPKPNFKLP